MGTSMPDVVDRMFEEMFGFQSKDNPVVDPPTVVDPIEAAARAVWEAVRGHTGRRKSVDAWKPVAAKALGITKLYKKRWDAVLTKGIGLGLLSIDLESLTYPTLVALEPSPEPEIEVPTRPVEKDESPKPGIPEGWKAPARLDCGHSDINGPHDKAQEDGFCCESGRKKYPPNYRYMKGEHRKPVPPKGRRTAEKVATGGFPGLCCDTDGYYIGGLANNCRRHNKARTKWCEYHRSEYEARQKARKRVKGKAS